MCRANNVDLHDFVSTGSYVRSIMIVVAAVLFVWLIAGCQTLDRTSINVYLPPMSAGVEMGKPGNCNVTIHVGTKRVDVPVNATVPLGAGL